MPADQPPPSAQRLRRRGNRLAIVFIVLTALGVGIGAWQLANSQSETRAQLRRTYDNRATVAAGVLQSLFNVAFQQSAATGAKQFGGAVTTGQLRAYAKSGNALFAAVVRTDGSVVARSPGAPATIDPALLARAASGGVAVGDLQGSGASALVESAVRFKAVDGVRLLVSGSPAKIYQTFLSGSLERLTGFPGDEAYVLDGHGAVLGAVSHDDPGRPPPPGATLARRARGEPSGFYRQSGTRRYFASASQPNTAWHVVVSVPQSTLYHSTTGAGRWLPWVILVILTLALIAVTFLVRRAILSAAQIAAVNDQLEVSQDRLRDRAIELQASNAELQRSNADLEQFAYVASHDLSAPLRAVAGFSQLLAVRYRGRLDDEADGFIGHMQDGVDRMQRIIDDLLAYSRVDRGGLRAEPVDLDAALAEVVHGLGPEIVERDAQVTNDPLGTAWGESGQVAQVLQNLVANGMKFTAPGVRPEVHVSAQRDGGRVRVTVRDNGIGIDPEHADRIFKMFQRLHTNEEYPGTGIGLAISQKIVERHGGRIVIEPAPGGGTAFTFDVPAQAPR